MALSSTIYISVEGGKMTQQSKSLAGIRILNKYSLLFTNQIKPELPFMDLTISPFSFKKHNSIKIEKNLLNLFKINVCQVPFDDAIYHYNWIKKSHICDEMKIC